MLVIDREDIIKQCILRLQSLDPIRLRYAMTCLEALLRCGPNAAETQAEIASRLLVGADRYPEDDFTTDRDWNQEAAEEALDETVYRTREAIRLRRLTRRA